MRIMKIIFIALSILVLPAYCFSAGLGSVRTSLIEGDVQIKTEDTSEWVPLTINMPVREGDNLWVPEGGRAELNMADGTYLRLNENSSIELLSIERDSSQFYIAAGRVYINFRGLRESMIQIDTAVSSIRAYDKAIFMVDVSDRGFTEVSVLKGKAIVESRSGRIIVSEGNVFSLRDDSYADLFPLGQADEWERWNRERDRRLSESRYSYRYLPEELSVYSHDFDNYGRWIRVKEYGYVWTPRVIGYADWAPYRNGRWVWIGGDYIWVSYDPWGWVPHHYGRWVFIIRIGWCWVPPLRGNVYWSPGYVGWVYTPTYVAWVPLAPRDIYYGYGYYGPYSVNIININIHKTVIKPIYKNIYVKNAVTVIHHDTFVKGKRVDIKTNGNPFVEHKVSVGRPQIKPEKETAMPLIKEIPHSKLPPLPIRERKPEEFKKERPLIKERDISVFGPDIPKKKMPVIEVAPKEQEKIRPVDRPKELRPRKDITPLEKPAIEDALPKADEKDRGRRPKELRPKETKPLEMPKELKPRKDITPLEKPAIEDALPKADEKDRGRRPKELRPKETKPLEMPKELRPRKDITPLEKPAIEDALPKADEKDRGRRPKELRPKETKPLEMPKEEETQLR